MLKLKYDNVDTLTNDDHDHADSLYTFPIANFVVTHV